MNKLLFSLLFLLTIFTALNATTLSSSKLKSLMDSSKSDLESDNEGSTKDDEQSSGNTKNSDNSDNKSDGSDNSDNSDSQSDSGSQSDSDSDGKSSSKSSSKKKPEITFVSIDRFTQGDDYRVGSLSGNVLLYLKGTGLSGDCTATTVYIGKKECPIDPISTSNVQIACRVPASDSPGFKNITVKVSNKQAKCDKTICRFKYDSGKTPVLSYIVQNAINPNTNVKFGGVFKVPDSSYLKLNLNDYICNSEVIGKQTLDPNNLGFVKCNVGALPVGFYDAKVGVTTRGDSLSLKTAYDSSDDEGHSHDLTILPQITSLSSHSGSTAGQVITITGSGFSSIPTENQVFFGDSQCQVMTSTYTSVKCHLVKPTAITQTGLKPGHAGLRRRSFSVGTNLADLMQTQQFLQDGGTKSQVLSAETEFDRADDFSEALEGFFKAPATGTYHFLLSAGGPAQLYVSQTPLVKDNLVLACEVTVGSGFRDFYDPEEAKQKSQGFYLEQGQYYYIQAVHIGTGQEHLTIGVTVPNNGERKQNSLRKVISLKVNAEVTLQQGTFKIKKPSSFPVVFGVRKGTSIVKGNGFTFPGKKSDVESQMESLGYPIEVIEVVHFDINKAVTQDPSKSVETHYKFLFLNTSTITTTSKPLGYPTGYVDVTLDNIPTSLLNGNFEIGLLGQTLTVRFDETEDSLRDLLQSIPGIKMPRVKRHGKCVKGCEWIIQFDSNTDNIPDPLIVSKGTLAGGNADKLHPSVAILQDSASNDLIYAPIPYNMLFTAETVPQITLKTKGLLASCPPAQCHYQVMDVTTPSILSYTLNGDTLEIFLKDAQALTNARLSVSFAGVPCEVISYDSVTQKLVAKIPHNSAGDPMIVAGTHTPVVIMDTTKILKVATDVVGTVINPVINRIDVDTSTITQGFIGFNIYGSGYGYSLSDSYGTSISIGGITCHISQLTNSWTVCLINEILTSGLVELTVNGLSTSSSFQVTIPNDPAQPFEIVSHTVDQASAESTFVMNGNGFDDSTNIVFSNKQTKETISCAICSKSATSITCTTSALPPGNYDVVASTISAPNSVSQQSTSFAVQLEISSVDPQFGSQAGGTVLTIQGRGFSAVLNDNQVSFGSMNYRCTVLEASETTIKCSTAANKYEVPENEPQIVHVLQRLEYVAQCTGSCEFSYSNSHTPTIDNLSHTEVLAGDHLTISGRSFTSNTQIRIAGVLTDVISVTDNEIVVEVPEISAGPALKVTGYDSVYGNFSQLQDVLVSHALQVTDYSPKVGSSAGTILTISGKGFSNNTNVTVGASACQVLTVTTSSLTCRTAPNSQGSVIVNEGVFHVTANTAFTVQESSTPSITAVSGLPITTPSPQITLGFQGQSLDLATPVKVTLKGSKLTYEGQIVTSDGTSIQAEFVNLSGGSYQVTVQIGDYIAKFDSSSGFNGVVDVPVDIQTATMVTSSFAGGVQLEIIGSGFTDKSKALSVKVEGFTCPIVSSTFDRIVCTVPPLISEATQSTYQFGEEALLRGKYFSSGANENPSQVFDNTTVTYFNASSTVGDCFFGVDFGQDLVASLTQIQFAPRVGMDLTRLAGSVLEGSTDNISYLTLSTVGTNVYDGWNIISSPMEGQSVLGFRYLRFRKNTALSQCEISEMRIKGILLSSIVSQDPTVVQASARLQINGKTVVVPDVVEYRADKTPVITSLEPKLGSSKGNTQLNLYGQNLAQTSEVKIDNVVCQIESVTDTQIVCRTGALPPVSQRPERVRGVINAFANGFGKISAKGVSFLYAERWSDKDTWGCGGFPKDYDSVHVETGMNLLIDISPPKLVAVVVEGALIFADNNINFEAEYVLIRNGFLQIGTEDEPIQNNIKITLYGNKGDPQLPIFGNKVIGLYEGVVDIHGKPRVVSAHLASTADANQNTIQVRETVDWKAGDRIVISSTAKDTNQNEERTIVSVTGDTVFLDAPLKYAHLVRETAPVEGETYEINAEVILLSRNIVIQGDDISETDSFGGHLLFYDPGTESTIVRISHTEITKAGQAGFQGRFPVNFQHAGVQMRSYLKGNSIHHTYQRGIQLQGTHYLAVQSNVLFAARGYGINLEDGVERFNVFEDNIVMGCRSTLQYLSTQENPIGFRISNPTNFFRRNKAISNPVFGFWFDLKSYTAGAYSSQKVCPSGEKLGVFEDNIASWNINDGIKFDTYIPRTYSCRQVQYNNQVDPFALNPPVTAVFKGNLVLGNKDRGIEAYNIGALVFDELKAIENGAAGIEIFFSEQAPINSTVISNSVFIGSTYVEQVAGNRGISLPRSEGLVIENTIFVNYTTAPAMEIDSAYYSTLSYDSGSRTVFVNGLKFIDVTARTKFATATTHIFRDLDGSLTEIENGGTLVNNLPHLQGLIGCSNDVNSIGGLACDVRTEFRRIVLYEVNPNTIYGTPLKVLRLSDSVDENSRADSEYTTLPYKYGRAPSQSYALPFALGYSYKVFFDQQLDFVSLTAEVSPHWISQDLPITLVFNHTNPREDYDLTRWDRIKGTVNVENSTTLWDLYQPSSVVGKSLGNWFHDFDQKRLYVALVGGDGTVVKMKGYECRVNCPPPPPGPTVAKKTVYWSNAANWPGQTLPKEWDNIVIPWDWSLIMDINLPAFSTIEIQGELIFSETLEESVLRAKKIWVRGSLVIGSETQPFSKKAKIVLLGTRNEPGLVVNNVVEAGTKVLAVTGQLSVYGQYVNERVSLVENIYPGSRTIKTSGDLVGWQAGNLIALTSSRKDDSVYEIVEIESISATGVITVKTGVKFFHYAGVFTNTIDGVTHNIDFSTQIMLLSRNVQIEGSNEDNWGGRILVTDEFYDTYTATGKVNLQYVSFNYFGQFADKAGLSFESMSNVNEGEYSIVLGTVMIDCLAWGVKFSAAQNIKFQQNIILTTRQFGVFFYDNNQQIQISKNYIFGTILEANVVYAFLNGVSSGIYLADLTSNVVTLQENVVAGCEMAFILKASACGTDDPYINNVAHSSNLGFLILTDAGKCAQISGLIAYRNNFGILSYSGASQITAKSLILTDNKVSINLNAVGKDQDQKVLKIQDSFFAAFALADCADCYESTNSCTANTAIMLGVATQEGKQMPPRLQDRPWEAIQSIATFNAKQVFTNNFFINFKDGILPQCSSNTILRTNKYASDYTPFVNLDSSHLLNVDQERNLVYFETASIEERCGNIPCTGLNNVLIQDLDGTFIGVKGSIIPNNPGVIIKNTCTLRSDINAYICNDDKFSVLEFESLDTDKLTRVISPVSITNSDGYTNAINAFKAHDYFTNYLFHRLARFASIIQKNKNYNIEFTGTLPSTLQFQIEGNALSTDFAILKVKYNDPQVITVFDAKQNQVIHPVRSEFDKAPAIKDSDPCGTNFFDRENKIINFKITADPNCKLLIKKTNVLAVNIRYDMTEDEFWQQGGVARFIDKVASILKISHSSIRVISLVRGSVIINFDVMSDSQDSTNTVEAKGQLEGYSRVLNEAYSNGELNVYPGARILDFAQQTVMIDANQPVTNSTPDVIAERSPLMVGLISAAAGLVVVLAVLFIYKYRQMRNKSKMVAKVAPDTVTRLPSLKKQFKLISDVARNTGEATPTTDNEQATFSPATPIEVQTRLLKKGVRQDVENGYNTDNTTILKAQSVIVAQSLDLNDIPKASERKALKNMNKKSKFRGIQTSDNEDDLDKVNV